MERLRKFILDLAVRGKFVGRDPTDESAYRKAAEQGFYLAQNNLWLSFLRGDGLPQDDVQAAIWFRRAAEQPSATRLVPRFSWGDETPIREDAHWRDVLAEKLLHPLLHPSSSPASPGPCRGRGS